MALVIRAGVCARKSTLGAVLNERNNNQRETKQLRTRAELLLLLPLDLSEHTFLLAGSINDAASSNHTPR